MYLNIINEYKSIFTCYSGSNLTDYLIKKQVLKERGLNCSIVRSEKGKPLICVDDKNMEIHVSVSHSENCFASILSDYNIGLDIQHERNVNMMKLSGRYYTQEEQELVNGDSTEFFRLWTRKEAYSKYTGEGLREIMGRLDVLNRKDVVFRDMVIKNDSGENCYIAVCAGKGADLNEIQISCGK